jgi:putative exosortase-associated protein (TIGR04073 family)
MKKTIMIVLIACIALTVSSRLTFAGERFDDMTYKLGRGLTNIVTGPLEILDKIDDGISDFGLYKGLPFGVVKGIPSGIIRMIVGVYEVITFPIDHPENNAPLIEPEFIFDRYNYVGSEY